MAFFGTPFDICCLHSILQKHLIYFYSSLVEYKLLKKGQLLALELSALCDPGSKFCAELTDEQEQFNKAEAYQWL